MKPALTPSAVMPTRPVEAGVTVAVPTVVPTWFENTNVALAPCSTTTLKR
jgi:hypothetical protein